MSWLLVNGVKTKINVRKGLGGEGSETVFHRAER